MTPDQKHTYLQVFSLIQDIHETFLEELMQTPFWRPFKRRQLAAAIAAVATVDELLCNQYEQMDQIMEGKMYGQGPFN